MIQNGRSADCHLAQLAKAKAGSIQSDLDGMDSILAMTDTRNVPL